MVGAECPLASHGTSPVATTAGQLWVLRAPRQPQPRAEPSHAASPALPSHPLPFLRADTLGKTLGRFL